jgi:hypothetical protein
MPQIVYRDFVPHAKQEPFYYAPHRFRAFVGGLGSGKSAVGMNVAIDLAIENPGCTGVVAAPKYSQVRDVDLVEFRKWCPDPLIRKVSESITGGLKAQLVNGSTILFRSTDKPHTLRGLNLAWFVFDEAAYGEEEAFMILLSRVRDPRAKRKAIVIITSPNGTRNWLHRKYRETFRPDQDGDWFWQRASSYDNPHTGEEYVNDLASNVSARAAQQEIDGEFVGAEGLVYGGDFIPSVHEIAYDYNPGRPVYVGFDPGFRMAALLAFQQRPEDGAWVCFDEEMPEDVGAQKLAHMLVDKPYASHVAGMVVDPAGLNNAQDTGAPLVAVFEEQGFAVEAPEERKIVRGIETVRYALRPYRGSPRLYFSNALRRKEEGWTRGVIKDLEAYHYTPNTTEDVPEHDDSSHSMDALRYFCLVKIPVTGGGGFGAIRRF